MIDKQPEKTVNSDVQQNVVGTSVVATGNTLSDIGKNKQIEPVTLNCPDPSATPTISKGEKDFNRVTYNWLNYWTNLISSVAIADKAINGSWRSGLDKMINHTTKFVTKFNVPIKTAHHHTKVGLETLCLLSGGMLLLIPLKILEDHKRQIVHKINKMHGVNQKAADGHEKTPDEIYIEKEQPKQSWGNVIWRRVEATAAVLAAGMGIDHFLRNKNKILPEEQCDLGWAKFTYDKKVQGGKNRIEEKVFGKINDVAKAIRGKEFKEKGIVSRWTKLLILDSVFTVISAVVMKITSGAKKAKMPDEIDDSKDPTVVSNRINRITTTADIEKNNRAFVDRVERRVKGLIDYKRSITAPSYNFAEQVQQKDSVTPSIGA